MKSTLFKLALFLAPLLSFQAHAYSSFFSEKFCESYVASSFYIEPWISTGPFPNYSREVKACVSKHVQLSDIKKTCENVYFANKEKINGEKAFRALCESGKFGVAIELSQNKAGDYCSVAVEKFLNENPNAAANYISFYELCTKNNKGAKS